MKTTLLCFLALLDVGFAQSVPKTMKAMVVHEYGGPEALKYETAAPVPQPKENQVLVKVIAAGVNPVDSAIRSGKYAKVFGTTLPLVPGYDIAGIVAKTGAKVTRFKAGDEVYAYPMWGGGYAEYDVVDEAETALKPKSISFVDAAGVPLAALTAWQALIDTCKIDNGQTVLIHGGSGGVGSLAVQIAKVRGAKVIASASTPNQDLLKELGADVPIDYTKQKFEDVAHDVDAVLDCVGKDTLDRSYAVVKKGGIIATIAGHLDQAQLDKHGIRGAHISVKPDGQELSELAHLIDEKKIKPVTGQVMALTDAARAQEQAATRHNRGKTVLKIAEEPKS